MNTPEGHNPGEFENKPLDFIALTGAIANSRHALLINMLGPEAVQKAEEKIELTTDAIRGLSPEEFQTYFRRDLTDLTRDPNYSPDPDTAEYKNLEMAIDDGITQAFGEICDGFIVEYTDHDMLSLARRAYTADHMIQYSQGILISDFGDGLRIEKNNHTVPPELAAPNPIEAPAIGDPNMDEVKMRLQQVIKYLENLQSEFTPAQLRELLQLDEFAQGFDEDD